MTPTDGDRRHLPECLLPDFDKGAWVCICAQLRACEERVRLEYRVGLADYAAGVQAALKAVQRVGIQPEPVQQYTKSIAAIDALRANNT